MKRTHFIFEFYEGEDHKPVVLSDWDADYTDSGDAEKYLRSLAEMNLDVHLRVEIWDEPPKDFLSNHRSYQMEVNKK